MPFHDDVDDNVDYDHDHHHHDHDDSNMPTCAFVTHHTSHVAFVTSHTTHRHANTPVHHTWPVADFISIIPRRLMTAAMEDVTR